jgi:ectoine hydroxylase-related dioxygenase (phytanoyl-CoA dioxygenase family)
VQKLSHYLENGYCVLEGFFEKDELLEVARDIRAVFGAQLPQVGSRGATDQEIIRLYNEDRGLYVACAKMAHNVPSFQRLAVDKRLLEETKAFGVDVPAVNTRPVIFFSSSHLASHHFYWKARPHQDWAGGRGSLDGIVAWVPIFEIAKGHGYLEVVPGSHLKGLKEHVKEGPSVEIPDVIPDDQFVSVPMSLGDVLLFSPFTIHRSGTNVTDEIRMVVNFRYDNMTDPSFVDRRFPAPFEYMRIDAPLVPPSVDSVVRCLRGKATASPR